MTTWDSFYAAALAAGLLVAQTTEARTQQAAADFDALPYKLIGLGRQKAGAAPSFCQIEPNKDAPFLDPKDAPEFVLAFTQPFTMSAPGYPSVQFSDGDLYIQYGDGAISLSKGGAITNLPGTPQGRVSAHAISLFQTMMDAPALSEACRSALDAKRTLDGVKP